MAWSRSRRDRRRTAKKLSELEKEAAKLAKYGSKKKPAPVLVRYMDDRPAQIKDQSQLTRKTKR